MKKVIGSVLVVAFIMAIGMVFMSKGYSLSVSVEMPTVTETFTVESIDKDGYVHGKATDGSEEGFYYHIDELTEYTKEVNEGDTVSIEWYVSDYEAENWDNVVVVRVH